MDGWSLSSEGMSSGWFLNLASDSMNVRKCLGGGRILVDYFPTLMSTSVAICGHSMPPPLFIANVTMANKSGNLIAGFLIVG